MSLKNPILSFTVKLSKWRCGGGESDDVPKEYTPENACHIKRLGIGDTALLNEDGFRCCLGFAATDGGYKRKLTGIGDPSELAHVIPGLTELDGSDTIADGGLIQTRFTDSAIAINDSTGTSVADKMRKLIALGKRNNIEVKFVP